jgi:hypothetical protein
MFLLSSSLWRIALMVALLVGSVAAQNAPCVPSGHQAHITFTRPSLIQANMPVGAEWHPNASGNPQAFESDVFSNDPMGPAAAGNPPDTASVDVTNQNGNLNDATGRTQNGGGEGDCIEVIVCWTYRFPVTVSMSSDVGIKLGEVEVGRSDGVSIVIWKVATLCSDEVVICPC